MAETTPWDIVRGRWPSSPPGDATELQEYANYLNNLRGRVSSDDLRGVEAAVTFDPTVGEPDG